MNIIRAFLLLAFAAANISFAFSAGCLVGGTDFETSSSLCSPTLTSDYKGWYSSKLDLKKECSGADMFTGPENVKQLGLVSNSFSSESLNDFTNIDDVFHLNNLDKNKTNPARYGYSAVTGNPKLAHSFAQSINNNMYINIGAAENFPVLSYTVNGLEPNSNVEISFTVYNLLDKTYFQHLADSVCIPGKGGQTPQISDFISKYNYSNAGDINGNDLKFSVSSSADGIKFNTDYNYEIQTTGASVTTKTVGFGSSATIAHTTKVPSTGSITFYFFRASDCFQIPIGIDDIRVEGSVKPAITFTGNPCPEQPLRIFAKQSYPEGTKYSWNASNGQTSTDVNFVFTPDAEETDYTITLEITLPGCTPSKSEPITVHSGTCCKSSTGAPMAMTNLFFDDFGNFVSDDTYEWTDRFGVTHTEKIPAGQVHDAQSHRSFEGDLKIPYVRAYNIEASGATLKVHVAGSVPNKTELYNHGVYVISKYGGYPSGVPYDNSGTQTGGMLQFDLLDDGSQDDFFEIDIDHICTGKEISFGADFASISEHPGSVEVVLEYNGNKLESDFRYFSSGADGWKSVNKSFTIKSEDVGGASEVTVKMKVRHYGKMADGTPISGETRDYGIDNIIFQVCTPPDVDVESSVSTGKDYLDLCTEDALTLTVAKTPEAKKALKQFYAPSSNPGAKLGFVYQYTFQDPSEESETNPITWKTIHKSKEVVEEDEFEIKIADYWDDIFAELDKEENKGKMIFFRVVVGEYSDLLSDTSWKTSSAFSPCRKISISTVRLFAGLNCAACIKASGLKILDNNTEGKYTAATATDSAKIELCPGQVAKFKTSTIKPSDPTAERDPSVGGGEHKYIATWHRGSKTAAGVKGIGYTNGDDESSLEVTWEDADEYWLKLVDLDFPEDGSCTIWHKIDIIKNEKPTDKLDDPAAFCEGGLATEPTKTITGMKIDWYSDADTTVAANKLSAAPVVGDVEKSDSPKEFYYVLTNEAGCRGDVETYTVTVNKADELTESDGIKVHYKKVDSPFSANLTTQGATESWSLTAPAGHKLMWGEVTGYTASSPAPDLSTATLGTASAIVPTPTVKDKNDSDPEYVWYYAYYVTDDALACESKKVAIGVEIKGAPTPIVADGAYCSTETAPALDKFAKVDNTDGGAYTLKFYKDDKTTAIADPSQSPDITTPGEYTFYVSQYSAAGGESAKVPFTIRSYGVKDAVISPASDKYCKDEAADAVETKVSAASSTNTYIVDGDLEIFKENEPTLNKAASTQGSSSMAVSTSAAGTTSYYARYKYEITTTASASLLTNNSVCYGKHEEYKVEVKEVLPPTGSGSITYLKDEGDPSKGNSFALPLTQDKNNNGGTETAVVYDNTEYELLWYKADGTTSTNEAGAKPDWNDVKNLTGNDSKTFYVTQKLKNAPYCESDKKEITIIVSGYPTPTPTPLEFCEDAQSGSLTATPTASSANPATDFELVWYKSKADGSIDDSAELTDLTISPANQPIASGESKTVYKYYVLQRLSSNTSAMSAPVPCTVTIYAKPKLEATTTPPICGNDPNAAVKLKDMFSENTKPDFTVTYNFTGGGISGSDPEAKVKDRGDYNVEAQYTIPSGAVCKSDPCKVTVIVHELKAEIDGSPKTCPNEAVDLKAVVTTEGGINSSTIKYDWSNNKNSETGTDKNYNTTSEGLENSGNKMRVSLTVEGGECKGVNAVKVTHDIEVGDGPLDGTIAFTESDNTKSPLTENVNKVGILFPSCGAKVKAEINVTATEDEYSYTKDGGSKQTGNFSSGKASLTLEEGEYEFSYINKCPTSFKFKIMDVSTKVKVTQKTALEICETENFNATIEVTPNTAGYAYEVKWYHGGDNTGSPLTTFDNSKTLSITNASVSDNGLYAFEVLSGGCVSKGEITDGLELTVKPYIKIDVANLKTNYEQIRGEDLTMTIPFLVPASPSAIENDIVWNDLNTGETLKGSTQTITMEGNHEYNIEVNSADYCPATAKVTALMEAKLTISAELDVDKMCIDENHTITVDTAGTGKFLHPGMVLKVEETVEGSTTTKNLLPSGGKLQAKISPRKNATYNVIYSYDAGITAKQEEKVGPLNIEVFPAFDVQWTPTNAVVCEGSSTEITITKCEPAGTTLTWGINSDLFNPTQLGVTVTPEFTSTNGYSQKKKYELVAENGICTPKTFYPTVTVDLPIEGDIKAKEYICEKTPMTLDASSFNAQVYKWYSEDQLGKDTLRDAIIKVTPIPEYAVFMLDVERGACKYSTQHSVVVTLAPKVDRVDSITYRKMEIVLESGTGTPPFKYIIDGDDKASDVGLALKEDLEYGKHTVKIIDDAGCEVTYKFTVNTPDISIPKMISPNGDGVGDIFKIGVLSEAYPDANVSIFDRWGKKIATYKAGDNEGWDGTYNGNPLPSTDYWYEVEIRELEKTYVGHFSLIRQ